MQYGGKLGAVETLNAKEHDNIAKVIRKMTGGGVDVAMEVIGYPPTIEAAYNAVRWGGRVIVVGYTHKDITINAGRMMFREIEMKGSLGCGLQDYPVLLNLIASGKINVKELVTHSYPLDEINEGLAFLDKGDPSLIRSIVIP